LKEWEIGAHPGRFSRSRFLFAHSTPPGVSVAWLHL
jgi:hypothetical protein